MNLTPFLRFRRLPYLSLVGMLLGACAHFDLITTSSASVSIVELPVQGAPVAWIDNDSILLNLDSGERATRQSGAIVRIFELVTFNYKTGERRSHGRVGTGLCFTDGYISHVLTDDATGELTAVFGELGKEIRRKVKPGGLLFDRGAEYRSCRPLSELPKPPAWAEGKYFVSNLRPEHGVVSCGTRDFHERNIRARYHTRIDPVGIQLPFTCHEVREGLRYYAFKGAYFTQENGPIRPWPRDRERKAYWLYPDGKVETLVFPYSTAIRGNMLPTAGGIVSFSFPDTREEKYRVHLIGSTGMRELFPGNGAGVVSPDGCKVAMLHDPDYTARVRTSGVSTPVRLILLDFCQNK